MSLDRPDRPEEAETLFAAWAVRAEAGEDVRLEDLLESHPEQREALTRLHEDWKLFAPLLGRAVPGKISEASGIVLAPIASHGKGDAEGPSPELIERLGINIPDSGRYRFRAVLGRGGGGVVLKVWDTKLNRALAMKVVLGQGEDRPTGDTPKLDNRTLSRFVDEARIGSQLNHPAIVPVYELGEDESGRAFFTMRLVKGQNLAQVFDRVYAGDPEWSQTRALTVLLRVCEAMSYAHDRGVIHRDLKPANVMVGAYGEVHTMDWGLARVLGQPDNRDLRPRPQPATQGSVVHSFRTGERGENPDSSLVTMDGSVLGTPCYMAPEQARGNLESVGPRTDVYAVGAMLYHLLTGAAPYLPGGAPLPAGVVLTNLLHGPPRPIESIAPRAVPELVAICDQAMARNSEARYESMRELAADLQAYLEGKVVIAYETGTWAETKKWVRRNKALAGGTALAVAVTICAALTLALQGKKLDRARIAAEESTLRERLTRYFSGIVGANIAIKSGDIRTAQRLLVAAPQEHLNWEWGYLSWGADKSEFTLEQDAPILLAHFESDGVGIRTVSEDGSLALWNYNAESVNAPLRLDGGRHISSPWLSPDARRVAAESDDGSFQLWDATTGASIKILARAEDEWFHEAYSQDGQRVLAHLVDGTVRLWDAQTGVCVASLQSDQELREASFSPDSTQVLTRSSAGLVSLWGSKLGEKLIDLVQSNDVEHATYSADGNWIATMSTDEVVLWSSKSFSKIGALSKSNDSWRGRPVDAVFSPDAHRVVTRHELGEADAAIGMVWDPASGDLIATLEGHPMGFDVTFSSDSTRFATSWGGSGRSFLGGTHNARRKSFDSVVRLWDAQTGALEATLDLHRDSVYAADFSPDGSLLVTASADGDARLWDGRTGKALQGLVGHHKAVESGQFSRDGMQVLTLSTDGTAKIWGVTNKQVKSLDHGSALIGAAFSPDGSCILTSADDGLVRIWDLQFMSVVSQLGTKAPGGVRSFEFSGSPGATVRLTPNLFMDSPEGADCIATYSPDGKRFLTSYDRLIVVGGENDLAAWSSHGSMGVILWDVASHAPLAAFDWAKQAVFSPDGERLALVEKDGPVHVLSARSLVEEQVLGKNTRGFAAFSPDGSWIVTGSADRVADVWDCSTGVPRLALVDSDDCLGDYRNALLGNAVRISPRGDWIATACGSAIRIWDSSTGHMRGKLDGHAAMILDVDVSQDGRWIATASADRFGLIWDAYSGQLISELAGHEALVRSVRFSPDGSRVLTSSHDGTARLWDPSTGTLLVTLEEHAGPLESASFSPDGTRILTASDDGAVRVWGPFDPSGFTRKHHAPFGEEPRR